MLCVHMRIQRLTDVNLDLTDHIQGELKVPLDARFILFFYLFIISTILLGVEKKVFERKPSLGDDLKEFISHASIDIDAKQNLCLTVCWYRFS